VMRTIRWNRSRAGFTLIEMLVVLSILGVLITMVGTRNTIVLERSRDASLMLQCQSYRNAIHQYVLETAGRFPDTLADLVPKHLPHVTTDWVGSRGSGKLHYDKGTGAIALYNQQDTAPETGTDAKGKPYGEY